MIIILFKEKIKPYYLKDYYNLIYTINIADLTCPNCKSSACFHHHGSYQRSMSVHDEMIELKILRIKCVLCKSTQALLLSGMVPYRRKYFIVVIPGNQTFFPFVLNMTDYINTCLKHARSFRCFFFYPT